MDVLRRPASIDRRKRSALCPDRDDLWWRWANNVRVTGPAWTPPDPPGCRRRPWTAEWRGTGDSHRQPARGAYPRLPGVRQPGLKHDSRQSVAGDHSVIQYHALRNGGPAGATQSQLG